MKTAIRLLIAFTLLPTAFTADAQDKSKADAEKKASAARPALTVTVATAEMLDMPVRLSANGSVAAWQEAILGAEIGGVRIIDLLADVGDSVKRGQPLAVLASEAIEAEVAQARAAHAEGQATLADARANAGRARTVQGSGALSEQQIAQLLTAEKTAEARLASLAATLDQALVRQKNTRIVASDDGLVSARGATLGAVVSPGQELFRLIRQSRLEWRAEVTAAELALVRPGQAVSVRGTGGDERNVTGQVRLIAPTVDPQTRNALVHVALPGALAAGFRPGMFASGEFQVGRRPALTIPQAALVLRDGFNYVFLLGDGNKVSQVRVQLGRRDGERFEVLSGLQAGARIVASGAAFLAEGDVVRVGTTPPRSTTSMPAQTPASPKK